MFESVSFAKGCVGAALIVLLVTPCVALGREMSDTYADTALETRVVRTLQADEALKGYQIDVVAEGCDVWLDGLVMWADEEDRAVWDAFQVEGVRRIHNLIKIAGVNDPNVGP